MLLAAFEDRTQPCQAVEPLLQRRRGLLARPLDGSDDYYGLRLQIWPGGEQVEVAHGDWHGAWLDWLAA